VETVYHNQCSEMNVCETKYPHAHLNALNIHGKCAGIKMDNKIRVDVSL